MFEFEKFKIYHYIAWKNRGLFFQKIEVFLKKIEVFFFANRPLQGFNPSTKVYWKIRVHGLQSRQCAAHSGARTARETKSLGCRMRRRQRAAHSGCRATKFVLSFGSNQAMRSPQRRTHCKDTKFFELIHGSPMMLVLVPSDMIWYVIWHLYYQRNEISVANRQRLLKKKSWINKNLCMSSTAGFRKWHNKSSPWNFAENEHESIRNSHITNASLYCD